MDLWRSLQIQISHGNHKILGYFMAYQYQCKCFFAVWLSWMGLATHLVVLTKVPAFYNSTFNTIAGANSPLIIWLLTSLVYRYPIIGQQRQQHLSEICSRWVYELIGPIYLSIYQYFIYKQTWNWEDNSKICLQFVIK